MARGEAMMVAAPARAAPVAGISDRARQEAERRTVGGRPPPAPAPPRPAGGTPQAG